jgi:hypothetical protein
MVTMLVLCQTMPHETRGKRRGERGRGKRRGEVR